MSIINAWATQQQSNRKNGAKYFEKIKSEPLVFCVHIHHLQLIPLIHLFMFRKQYPLFESVSNPCKFELDHWPIEEISPQ